MIPALTLLGVCLALFIAGVIDGLVAGDFIAWPVLACLTLALALVDAFLVFRRPQLEVRRDVAVNLPVGVQSDIELEFSWSNPAAHMRRLILQVWDHHPPSFEVVGFPQRIELTADRRFRSSYRATPTTRGQHQFGPVALRVRSPLGLWWRTVHIPVPSAVRVYPNFSPLTKYIRLSVDARASLLGVRRLRRRGTGSEFHELRDYREGDSMRQIDWRATSRVRRLISRAYQDERDQRVVFLLDCGRRMRATGDSGLSHFDEALNAVLLLAYMALRQGDSVAMGTFGAGEGVPERWMGPVKGPGRVNDVLNMLYDLEPSQEMPDYHAACTDLLGRHQKHALVVLVTNLRGEDASDVVPALRLMRRRHLVLVASLRESALDEALRAPVKDFDTAARISGVHELRRERAAVLRTLHTDAIACLDVTPSALSAELLNAYLALKASRAL